jgi:hypothetical protein
MKHLLFWVTIALIALQFVLMAVGRSTAEQIIAAVVAAAYAITGWLLITRVAGNAVAWIIAVTGVVIMLAGLSDGYLAAAPADPHWAHALARWGSDITWNVWLFALVTIALPLLFPDGRLPSPRWRWVAGAGIAGAALSTIGVRDLPAVFMAGQVLTSLAGVGAIVALVVRLRRAHGVERQQLKWIAYVLGLAGAALLLITVLSPAQHTAWGKILAPVLWFGTLALIGFAVPLATGFAVLRHRLYDIDVVIKRTLIYGALTAVLGAFYLGGILLLQLLLSPSSDLAIAGSTLAVAALFRPLRTRVQRTVNHRFYRSAYDAQHTIETFGARVRNTVSLESLSDELSDVVRETMQPAHVSLWLMRR